MIDRYKKACLVLATVAVLAISFPTTPYSAPPEGVDCLWLKESTGRTLILAHDEFKFKIGDGKSWMAKGTDKLKEIQNDLRGEIAFAADLATIYNVFCRD